jgi:myo-inositol-1(or 4)-monophosphatase
MLNIAVRAARRAGTIIIRQLGRAGDMHVETKGRHDYVSEVDRAAEVAIVDTLTTAYPDHQILAEESGVTGDSEYVWIVDPLDGTTNFLHAYPQFAVSIALQVRGRLDQAVVYDPTRDELFTASRGHGAQLNNRRMRVGKCRNLDAAMLATGFPLRNDALIVPHLETLRAFLRRVDGVRRAGAASLDLAYVACGRLDGFWEFGLSAWDIAAGALLIQESGGLVGDPDGGERHLERGDVVAGNPRIFRQILETLARTPGGGS